MKKPLLIIGMCLAIISCERRPLSYDYDPRLEIVVNADWSDMSEIPTGMSVYCYPEGEDKPVVKIANISSVQSSVKVKLGAGKYNILVFNQVPSDYGTISFDGMDRYETAEINAVSTTSKWATSKAESELIREPEELAAATYLGFEITEEEIDKKLYADYHEDVSDDFVIQRVIDVAPEVVIKTTRVRVRLSGIYNLRSSRATLYGMASGYDFSEQKSHTTKSTHLLENWSAITYEDYREGEIYTYYTCFGMPEQTDESLTEDYNDWDGVMDVEFLLVDNETIVNHSYDLNNHVILEERESRVDGEEDDEGLDRDADIYIDLDFGDDDKPIVLPDVRPVGGSSSGFDATVEDWGPEEGVYLPI